jgi:hypothetical protein
MTTKNMPNITDCLSVGDYIIFGGHVGIVRQVNVHGILIEIHILSGALTGISIAFPMQNNFAKLTPEEILKFKLTGDLGNWHER